MLLILLATLLAQHPFNFLQKEGETPTEIFDDEEEESDIVIIPNDEADEESIIN